MRKPRRGDIGEDVAAKRPLLGANKRESYTTLQRRGGLATAAGAWQGPRARTRRKQRPPRRMVCQTPAAATAARASEGPLESRSESADSAEQEKASHTHVRHLRGEEVEDTGVGDVSRRTWPHAGFWRPQALSTNLSAAIGIVTRQPRIRK